VQIEPRYVNLTETCFVATPEKISAACDKNTIGVVGILGTTYSGHYEDIAGIDAAISAFSSHPSLSCWSHPAHHEDVASSDAAERSGFPSVGGFVTPAISCCHVWSYFWHLQSTWLRTKPIVSALCVACFFFPSETCGQLTDPCAGEVNSKNGWDIKIHVDGASGGFVVPFLYPDLKWDFRLQNVVSVNASGHKWGLHCLLTQ
jgi:hypothetical protein